MAKKPRTKSSNKKSHASEALAVVLVAAAVLLLLSVVTFNPKDPSWNSIGPSQQPKNIIGIFGAYVGDFFLQMFGLASLAIPVLLVLIAIATRAFFSERTEIPVRKALGAGLLLLALSGFLALFPKFGFGILEHSRSNGGGVGYVIEGTLASALNIIGAAIVLTAASLLTLMLTMEVSFATINSWLRPVMKVLAEGTRHFRARWAERTEQRRIQAEQREAERAEERKRLEAEMKEREREEQARLQQLRKLQEEERKRKAEEARRLKEQQPVIAKPIIREPIIKEPIMSSAAVVSPVVATTG
ncbi:MAG TPA: DNA translocase FtsK 4TM domain-containing protein, partial [Blastocatellia bacterium]|nr:DNA translocase FtsK 4TM domain-containing protein [Blastocatellia bacterium]